jgi:hypothetical protein
MFESICIRHNQDTGSPLDLGFLAEALLYYRRVHICGDRTTLTFLTRTLGPEVLLDLLQSNHLGLDYWENIAVVMTHTCPAFHERHRFETADMPYTHLQHVAPKLFQDLLGKSGKGRRMANRLMSHINPRFFSSDRAEQSPRDLGDERYLQESVAEVVKGFVPEYSLPSPFAFKIVQDRLPPGATPPDPHGFDSDPKWPYFHIETNIDFARANALLHRRVPATEMSLTPAYLVGFVNGSRIDLLDTSQMSAEIALSPIRSAVLKCRFAGILKRRLGSEEKIEAFHEFVIGDSSSVREAVNSGARNFSDVMRLLESAQQFKDWIQDRPDDADLRREYCRSISHVDWADLLPTKSIRWSIFAAANIALGLATTPIAGIVGGLGLSALDSLLLDKIIKGWRPNQFIEGDLRRFVQGQS